MSKRVAHISLSVLLCLLLVGGVRVPSAHADYPGPESCDTSWYDEDLAEFALSTPEQLAGLAYLVSVEHVTFAGKKVLLVDNIDLSGICSGGVNWRPIGTDYTGGESFQGIFDGQNFKVSNLLIDDSGYYNALFGSVKHATIQNLIVSGEVRGCEYVGGIISMCSDSDLINLTNECTVDAVTYNEGTNHEGRAAGVVCYVGTTNPTGDRVFEHLVNRGTIKSTSFYTAGVVGFLLNSAPYKATLYQCANYGDVTVEKARYGLDGAGKAVGGVLGSTANDGYGTYELVGCLNAGTVTSANSPTVGGVAGFLGGDGSSLSFCENTGNVSGSNNAGGVMGYLDSSGGRLNNSLNMGSVQGKRVGGVLGSASRRDQSLALNYTLEDVCPTAYGKNSGGNNEYAAYNAATMKTQHFLDVVNDGTTEFSIVAQDNAGLPILTWTNPSALPGLGGVESDPQQDEQQGASGGSSEPGDSDGAGDASAGPSEGPSDQTDASAQDGQESGAGSGVSLPERVSPKDVGAGDPTAAHIKPAAEADTAFQTQSTEWRDAPDQAQAASEAAQAAPAEQSADDVRADRPEQEPAAQAQASAESEEAQADDAAPYEETETVAQDERPTRQLVEVIVSEDGMQRAQRGVGTPIGVQVALALAAIACLAAGALRENAAFGRSTRVSADRGRMHEGQAA